MRFEEIYDGRELHHSIYISFFDDTKLVSDYHVINDDLEDCVRDTYQKIVEESNRITLDWFNVYDDLDKVIGFLVVSKAYNVLYSFGLNIHSRQDYKEKFFNEICKMFGGWFSCALWNKNKRAIRFLERMGMSSEEQIDNNITILKICQ